MLENLIRRRSSMKTRGFSVSPANKLNATGKVKPMVETETIETPNRFQTNMPFIRVRREPHKVGK